MPRATTPLLACAVALAASVVAVFVLRHLSYPLLWNDEADTVVFAERVLDFGVPNVTGAPSLLYHVQSDRVSARGIYRGGLWGGHYAALPAVALARGVQDFHERTARVRLPFALYGLASLAVLLLGLTAGVGPGRARRLAFALAYLIATATSISLLLHLREARYYAPLTLAVAAVVVLFLRRRQAGGFGYGAGLVLGLFVVFNLFYPAFLALVAWIALVHALEEGLGGASPRAKVRRLAQALLPAAAALLAALPVAIAFELHAHPGVWWQDAASSARSYSQNLAFVALGLLRYELIGPAIVARIAVVTLGARGPAPRDDAAMRLPMAAALLLLVALYAGMVSAMPLVWERYLVFLSPLITAGFLLDVFALAPPARAAGRMRLGLVVTLACAALVFALRAQDVIGHLTSLRVPVHGPLDFVIPHLAQRHPDAASLVIATNYEGPAYTWYLGSHVILGFYGGNLEQDLELVPDVIVPRNWPRNLRHLFEMAGRASYVRTDFPVAAVRTNQSPSLWSGSPGGVRHAFRTPLPQGPERTFVLERADP